MDELKNRSFDQIGQILFSGSVTESGSEERSQDEWLFGNKLATLFLGWRGHGHGFLFLCLAGMDFIRHALVIGQVTMRDEPALKRVRIQLFHFAYIFGFITGHGIFVLVLVFFVFIAAK